VFVSPKKVSDTLQFMAFMPIGEKDSSPRDTRDHQTSITVRRPVLFYDEYRGEVLIIYFVRLLFFIIF
jgi:hypothetical protein